VLLLLAAAGWLLVALTRGANAICGMSGRIAAAFKSPPSSQIFRAQVVGDLCKKRRRPSATCRSTSQEVAVVNGDAVVVVSLRAHPGSATVK